MHDPKRKPDVIMCGPVPPTAGDLAVVETMRNWLRGDRSVWGDDGLDVEPGTSADSGTPL